MFNLHGVVDWFDLHHMHRTLHNTIHRLCCPALFPRTNVFQSAAVNQRYSGLYPVENIANVCTIDT